MLAALYCAPHLLNLSRVPDRRDPEVKRDGRAWTHAS